MKTVLLIAIIAANCLCQIYEIERVVAIIATSVGIIPAVNRHFFLRKRYFNECINHDNTLHFFSICR